MFHKIVASTLVVTVTWATGAMAAPIPEQVSTSSDLAYEQTMAQLDRFMTVVEEVRSHIDRSQFDIEALLDKLQYDAASIISFVTNEIYFEQYPGLLRGAKGTLMSKAGNSLDQSILLATLLRDAGYDARIVAGELSPEDALVLVRSMNTDREVGRERNQNWFTRDQFDRLVGAAAVEGDHERLWKLIDAAGSAPSQLVRRVNSDALEVLEALEAADIDLERPAFERELVAEAASSYAWVEYRFGRSGGWVSVHPAWPTSPGPNVQASAVYGHEIPENMTHRFRFRVVIEQSVGKETRLHEVIAPWEKPTANLVAQPLSFVNYPDSLNSPAAFQDMEQALESARFYVPLFSASGAGRAFDHDGNVIPLDALSSPAAGVFDVVGDALEGAAGALSGLGGTRDGSETQDLVALRNQYLEFTLIEPGGKEHQYRRVSLGELDSVGRGIEPRASLLETAFLRHNFMISVGSMPGSFLMDRVLDCILRLRPMYELLLDQASGVETSVDAGTLLNEPLDWGLELLTLYSLFDSFPARESQLYRHEPSLVVLEERFGAERIQVLTDIVSNSKRSIRVVDGQIRQDLGQSLRSGAWDSRIEGRLHPLNPGMHFDVPSFLDELGDNTHEVIAGEDALRTAGLDRAENVEIERELERGDLVILVRDGQDLGGYWSVAPESGYMVARALGNRGVSATEWIIGTAVWAFWGVLIATVPCTVILSLVAAAFRGGVDETITCGAWGTCAGLGADAGGAIANVAVGSPEASSKATATALAAGFIAASALIGFAVGLACSDAQDEE